MEEIIFLKVKPTAFTGRAPHQLKVLLCQLEVLGLRNGNNDFMGEEGEKSLPSYAPDQPALVPQLSVCIPEVWLVPCPLIKHILHQHYLVRTA